MTYNPRERFQKFNIVRTLVHMSLKSNELNMQSKSTLGNQVHDVPVRKLGRSHVSQLAWPPTVMIYKHDMHGSSHHTCFQSSDFSLSFFELELSTICKTTLKLVFQWVARILSCRWQIWLFAFFAPRGWRTVLTSLIRSLVGIYMTSPNQTTDITHTNPTRSPVHSPNTP